MEQFYQCAQEKIQSNEIEIKWLISMIISNFDDKKFLAIKIEN